MAVVALALSGDRFTVGDLRGFGIDIDFIAIFEFAEHHSQVQISHAVDHQFFGLNIMRDCKACVLGCEFIQCGADLAFVTAGCWLKRQCEHRFGQGKRFKSAGKLAVVNHVTEL